MNTPSWFDLRAFGVTLAAVSVVVLLIFSIIYDPILASILGIAILSLVFAICVYAVAYAHFNGEI